MGLLSLIDRPTAIQENHPMKRLLLLLLASVFVFAAACGSDDPVIDVAMTDEAADDAITDEAMADGEAMDADATTDGEAMDTDATTDGEAMVADASKTVSSIVSLSPSATEILFAIGAGPQVTAVDEFSNYPADAPTVAGLSGYTPNVEAIAEFAPDLIVASAPIEGIDVLGAPVIVQGAAVTIDDVYDQIAELGLETGHADEAAALIASMRADIDEIVASLEPTDGTPMTFFHELDDTLYSVTSATFIGEMYSTVGLQNVADAADPDGASFGYPQLSEEFLVTANPDIIFLADANCCGQTPEIVAERPGWDAISAVQNGNIVVLDEDVASRWGPRVVELLGTLRDAANAASLVPAG